MAKVCDICGGKLGLILSFPVKDGKICNSCYDKLQYIIDTLKLDKKIADFTLDEAKTLIKNFDIAKGQSDDMSRIIDSEIPDANGMLRCAYCRKPMKKGILNSIGIKKGRICTECSDRMFAEMKFVKNAPKDIKMYTIKDMDMLFSEYEKYKNNLSDEKRVYIENEEKSLSKDKLGLGQFFKDLGDESLKRKAEKAIAEAYQIEQEKRKPHINRIEHQRPLTPQEQQTIDMLEMQAMQFASSQSEKMYGGNMSSDEKTGAFVNTLFMGDEYQKKIDEIKSRAIWYEEVQVPPEVDPSTPINVDEEAIRKKIYGNRYVAITESTK